MQVTVISPPRRYRVIVAGGREAARDAVARWCGIHQPMTAVSTNGYGAVHATVWADAEEIRAWWHASHDAYREGGPPGPGTLTWARRTVGEP